MDVFKNTIIKLKNLYDNDPIVQSNEKGETKYGKTGIPHVYMRSVIKKIKVTAELENAPFMKKTASKVISSFISAVEYRKQQNPFYNFQQFMEIENSKNKERFDSILYPRHKASMKEIIDDLYEEYVIDDVGLVNNGLQVTKESLQNAQQTNAEQIDKYEQTESAERKTMTVEQWKNTINNSSDGYKLTSSEKDINAALSKASHDHTTR